MKRRVIEIRNYHLFRKGVTAYVVGLDLEKGSVETAPFIDKAINFATWRDPAFRILALEFVKESFRGADVNLIEV